MGKLVVGIVVVVFLQIAFTIYLASDGAVDSTETAFVPGIKAPGADFSVINPRIDVTESEEPSIDSAPVTPVAARNSTSLIDDSRRSNSAAISRRSKNDARYAFAEVRRPQATYSQFEQSDPIIRRERFGRMMVEYRYGLSNEKRPSFPKARVEKAYFGNMVVEHKFEVSAISTKNLPKARRITNLS